MSDDQRTRTAMQNMTAGYAGESRDRATKLADTFVRDEAAENLIALRERDPDRFERITSSRMRLGLGHYEEARAAAIETGRL